MVAKAAAVDIAEAEAAGGISDLRVAPAEAISGRKVGTAVRGRPLPRRPQRRHRPAMQLPRPSHLTPHQRRKRHPRVRPGRPAGRNYNRFLIRRLYI